MNLHGSFNAAALVVPLPDNTESTHVNGPLNNNQNHGPKHDQCLNYVCPNNGLETTLSEEESCTAVTEFANFYNSSKSHEYVVPQYKLLTVSENFSLSCLPHTHTLDFVISPLKEKEAGVIIELEPNVK
jgi:hypothetical protein